MRAMTSRAVHLLPVLLLVVSGCGTPDEVHDASLPDAPGLDGDVPDARVDAAVSDGGLPALDGDLDRDASTAADAATEDGGVPVDAHADDATTADGGSSPPMLDGVTLAPDPAFETSTLFCTPGVTTDPDGTTVFGYTYAWTVGGVTIGATTSTLAGADFSRGDVVACVVTPDDGALSGSPVTSNEITVSNSVPSIAAAIISPDPARAGDTLTCSEVGYADDDGDASAPTYAWTVGGSPAGAGPTLSSGFTGGDVVVCTVTPHDGTSSGAAVSSASLTIANTPPVLASVSLAPSPAYETTTLLCIPGATSDADGTSVSVTYAWTVDGAAVAETTATLTGAFFSLGNTVSCTVTPTDGTSAGTPVTSNTVTISNTPPVLAAVGLAPTTAYEATTLTCTPGTYGDADGESVTLSYSWTVNGASIAATTATLTGVYFGRGDIVACIVTPNDATSSGAPVRSSTVTISDTAPSVAGVTVSPSPAYTDTTLTCTPSGGFDADGDMISYTYQWFVNSVVRSGETGSTIAGTQYARGDAVYCRVTPLDGTMVGAPVSSASVPISNTPPTTPGVTITPTMPADADPLVCSITTASTDADADPILYSYSWTRNGLASAITTSTVPASATSVGDVWTCGAQASDGTGTSGPGTSGSVTVLAPLYRVGNATEFAGTGSEAINYLFAERVVVSSPAALYQMGHIFKIDAGASFQLALYTDAAGAPGTLVAETAVTGDAVGVLEPPVVSAPVAISAGTYWMVWRCGGANCRSSYTMTGVAANVIYYRTYPFASPFPATFGAAVSFTGQSYNTYLVVR
jgi:hypothetical protein